MGKLTFAEEIVVLIHEKNKAFSDASKDSNKPEETLNQPEKPEDTTNQTEEPKQEESATENK